MTDLVPPDKVEQIVGARRERFKHIARADSHARQVTIMHSQACLDTGQYLRNCRFSLALDRGIDVEVWRGYQDRPVTVIVWNGRLVPREVKERRVQPPDDQDEPLSEDAKRFVSAIRDEVFNGATVPSAKIPNFAILSTGEVINVAAIAEKFAEVRDAMRAGDDEFRRFAGLWQMIPPTFPDPCRFCGADRRNDPPLRHWHYSIAPLFAGQVAEIREQRGACKQCADTFVTLALAARHAHILRKSKPSFARRVKACAEAADELANVTGRSPSEATNLIATLNRHWAGFRYGRPWQEHVTGPNRRLIDS